MNARQKAKKCKKYIKELEEEVMICRIMQRAQAFKENVRREYGTIETLKVVNYCDDRVPEEFLKEKMSREIAEHLLREGYIDFKVSYAYNEYNTMRRVVATIKVTKVGDSE